MLLFELVENKTSRLIPLRVIRLKNKIRYAS